MELLHDSDNLVGSLDCQLKRLEEKIDTSQPVALMKDLHRLDDEIRHFKDVEITTNKVVSSVKEQGETIKKLEEGTRNKFTEITSQNKATEAMVADKHKDLVSKVNDISSRVNRLEEKIELAVRELKSEARKTSVLRKLLWLD
jgi:type I site-specific restriction endonuclease